MENSILAEFQLYRGQKWWNEVFKGDERFINYALYGVYVTNEELNGNKCE